MNDTESSLLAAVCAAPDDDGPRLVMADFYDENGDPARAEYIRLAIRLHGTATTVTRIKLNRAW